MLAKFSENSKPFLTPDEFRAAMGNTIGRASIYKLLAAGRIKKIAVGRKILIPSSELVDFPKREAEGADDHISQ